MRPVFNNKDLQDQFDLLGYVVIPQPFLEPDEVEVLKQHYFDTLPERGGSFLGEETDFKFDAKVTYDFTFTDRNWQYKQKVFDLITARFQAHYEALLDNYKPIIANFIRKEEKSGEVPLHQNWAFVDERRYTSVSIWVPLVDSNLENGTLQMLDGSHKRFGELRGPMIPWECLGIGPTLIQDHLTPMNVKAGTAVVLDDSVIHYSNINQTNGLRLTIQLILVPAEATPIHHHLDPQKDPHSVEIMEVDRDFFMRFHPWMKPNGKVIGHRPFRPQQLSMDDFRRRMAQPRFDSAPQHLLGRLKRLFSRA
jgi:ectoine hydroxylase-related dioxygenase (phytanoyl-CoA dioxygenase family)